MKPVRCLVRKWSEQGIGLVDLNRKNKYFFVDKNIEQIFDREEISLKKSINSQPLRFSLMPKLFMFSYFQREFMTEF